MLVFVYGTLRKGYYNHSYLEGSQFISDHITNPVYTMVNLGLFPAVLPNGISSIHGELYEINKETLEQLDTLEGYPSFYNRIEIDTKYGDAYIYILNNSNEHEYPVIKSGIWE